MKIIKLLIVFLLIPSLCIAGQFRGNFTEAKKETTHNFHHNEQGGSTSYKAISASGGSDMALYNGATFAGGRYGNAIFMDGVNDYAETTGFYYANTNTVTVAFSMNFTTNSASSAQDILVGGHFQYFAMDFASSYAGIKGIFIWLKKDGDYALNWTFATRAIFEREVLGKWHRMVYVFENPVSFRLYFDGMLVKETAITTSGATNGVTATLRYSNSSGGTQVLSGMIDEFIYSETEAWKLGRVKKDYEDWKGRHYVIQEN